MRSNERRFIDNALNNTAWAVVIDVGENPRIDDIRYSRDETVYKFAYPLVVAPNEHWRNFCDKRSYTHDYCQYSMMFFRYNTKIRTWRIDVLPLLSVECSDHCWVYAWTHQSFEISTGDMFILCTNGAPLSMRFLRRIEKCFLNLYKDTIINVLEQYNVPIPKSLNMKLQESTIL